MVATQQLPKLTPQEYLDWEAQQPLRYEYFQGEVFAMAGGTLPRADIAVNIIDQLRSPLKGHCKVRNSDAKVGITDDGPFVYLNVSVTCDERDHTAQKFSRYPCLVVAVMSSGTEAYNRGGKFALYRQIETLQEYVLFGSESKTIEVLRRDGQNGWTFTPYGEFDRIELASVGVTITVEDVYKDVVFAKT